MVARLHRRWNQNDSVLDGLVVEAEDRVLRLKISRGPATWGYLVVCIDMQSFVRQVTWGYLVVCIVRNKLQRLD